MLSFLYTDNSLWKLSVNRKSHGIVSYLQEYPSYTMLLTLSYFFSNHFIWCYTCIGVFSGKSILVAPIPGLAMTHFDVSSKCLNTYATTVRISAHCPSRSH